MSEHRNSNCHIAALGDCMLKLDTKCCSQGLFGVTRSRKNNGSHARSATLPHIATFVRDGPRSLVRPHVFGVGGLRLPRIPARRNNIITTKGKRNNSNARLWACNDKASLGGGGIFDS